MALIRRSSRMTEQEVYINTCQIYAAAFVLSVYAMNTRFFQCNMQRWKKQFQNCLTVEEKIFIVSATFDDYGLYLR